MRQLAPAFRQLFLRPAQARKKHWDLWCFKPWAGRPIPLAEKKERAGGIRRVLILKDSVFLV
jgi:hypothetical protein